MSKALKILAVVLFMVCGAFGQTVWPGQTGNTVGYAAWSGFTGAFSTTACGAPTSGTSWSNATVKNNCTYNGGQTISCNYCIFTQVDFNAGTSQTFVTGSHIIFLGCRFQSNLVSSGNLSVGGSFQYYIYDSIEPLVSLAATPPGNQWPSGGAGANSTTQVDGTNAINGNNGYEDGVTVNSGVASLWIDHSDIWGFGHGIHHVNSVTGPVTITNNWIHDAADASQQSYHTDGIGFENGGAGPNNLTIIGNTVATLGSDQALALQAATSGYQNVYIADNFWSGDGSATIAFCQPGSVHCTNSYFYGNTFGTDVMPGGFLYSPGSALGSGSVWACNTIEFLTGTTWTAQSWTPTSAMNGQFFNNAAPPNSATDQGGNTVCGIPSPGSLGWPRQTTSTTSNSQSVTLKNTGSSTLTISSIGMATGTQFAQTNNCPGSLAAGASCTISVTFTPTSLGPQTDNLQITDNVTGVASPQLVPLSGIGSTVTDSNSCSGFATQTCPSAPYAPPTGVTNFYFISTSGNDANSGRTEASPWAHLPGMPTFTGTHTPAAGDGFILRGCDDWGNANFPVSFTQSGTSGSPIYVGVDPLWKGTCTAPAAWAASTQYYTASVIKPTTGNAGGYTFSSQYSITNGGLCTSGGTQPASWTQTVGATTTDGTCTWYNAGLLTWNRPIWDAQAAVIAPPECTNTNAFWSSGTSSNITVSWIELTGYFWANTNPQACNDFLVSVSTTATNVHWEYPYVHKWTYGSGAGNLNGNAFNNGCPTCSVDYMVQDNFDGTHYSGGGQQWPTTHSVFAYSTNAIKPHMGGDYSFNNISHMNNGPAGSGATNNHANCIETIGPIPSGASTFWIHDNWIHDMPLTPNTEQCQDLQVGNTGETDYVFNNVWCCDIGGGDIMRLPQNSQPNVTALYMFNNVWEENNGGGVCGAIQGAGNEWLTAFVMSNNFCLVPNTPNGTTQSQLMLSGNNVTGASTISFTNNIVETMATAAGHGCSNTTFFPYAPGSSSCRDTAGTGVNLTSTFWPVGYNTNDTGFACSETYVNGVIQPVCPQRVANVRPTSAAWDSSAYQAGSNPQGGTPTFSPPGGTYTGTQSVTISTTSGGAIICYTTNGSTPVTNQTTGCTTGTLYNGAVSVSVSETLKAVAGGTGFADSPVGSAAYTIKVQAVAPTFSPVAGTYIGPQSVQISTSAGSVICYNTTGGPGPINGGSTCPAGSTLYTGTITVPVGTETLYAIAGGSGFADSTVSSAAYVVHPVMLWSNILDWSRGTNWTLAGIPGGIPNRVSVCQTVSLATGSAAAAANATAIQNAINACAGTNQVVLIPTGTWYTNGFFVSGNGGAVNNNVTLRGAGPDKTVLLMQSTVACFNHADVCLSGNGNGFGRYNGAAPWVGDNGVAGSYTNGDTVIDLGTWVGNAPARGDLITLDQRDDSIGLCPSSGGTGSCAGNQGATESGTTVTLTTSLPHTYAIGNQVYVGGVSQPPPANGALGGQIFQSLIYPTAASCTSGTVTVTYGQSADFLPSETLTITAGAWASGVETLTVTSNPFTSHINGIRAVAISGTGTTLDSNTFVLNFAGNTSTTIAFNLAAAPATQPTAGTASYGGDVIWISGSNGIYSGVHTVTGTSGLTFTYAATCGGSFSAGNYILNPISYTGLWTITDIGCNVAGTYTTSASCGANPINALKYTSPVSGLISSGGGEVSVDTGGFYVSCVGGSNCASQGGSGVPGAPMRQCPTTNFGTGGTAICATGEYSYREQREVHQITNVNGNLYTITPPISNTNWRTSQNPGAVFLGSGAYATGISIEGLTVDGTNDNVGSQIDGLIVLSDCFQCWVKNVRTINGHRNHIWLPGPTAQSEVVDSYMFGSPGAAKSYGIETSGSGDLEQNNICQHVVTCHMTAGADSSVFAYTYTVDSGINPPTDNIALVAWNHDNAFYDLFEGMDINMGIFDTIHGNSDANTILRNRIVGQDIPKKVNYLSAVQNESFNRVENYVGNILGTVGQQTVYSGTTNSSGTTNVVYEMGYWSVDGTLQDALTSSTSLRWGNYDTASSAVRWCGTSSNTGWSTTCSSASEIPTTGVPFIGGNLIPTQGDTGGTIPPSFYLASQPLFWQTTWGTPHFPAIGPDVVASGGLDTTCTPVSTSCDGVGHYSYQIPAQLCYNNLSVDPAYQQTFTVTNATWASGTATLTIGANTLGSPTANTIVVSGVTPAGFNGTYAVSSAGATTVSYLLPTNPGSVGTTGTVAYPNILLYSGTACYPAAYPATVPAPAGVIFTKLSFPKGDK